MLHIHSLPTGYCGEHFDRYTNTEAISEFSYPSVALFQNVFKCETFHMKMNSACSFIFKQIKVICIRMVSHLNTDAKTANKNAASFGLGSVNNLISPPNRKIRKQTRFETKAKGNS